MITWLLLKREAKLSDSLNRMKMLSLKFFALCLPVGFQTADGCPTVLVVRLYVRLKSI
jgi:hypothetical protein